jgi:two-component system nitrate/nitrite response regulator NarL
VKVHVKAILRKIRVQNRTQAAIWGMNNGSLTNPVEVISGIKQIGASPPLAAIGHDANHVNVLRIDHLIRKGI